MHRLRKNKKSAIILGCGSSINLLKKEYLPWLNSLDKWASNNFLIHDFIVPDFYNVETKMYAKDFLIKMIQLKKDKYQNTMWMISGFDQGKGCRIIPDIIRSDDFANIYCYHLHFISNTHEHISTIGHIAAKRSSSMTILVDSAYALRYETIYFMGIDLHSSEYFWTDNPRYEGLSIPSEIMYNQPNFNKKTDPHKTTDVFLEFMSEFIDSRNTNMINLSPSSLLAEVMPTKNIEDFYKNPIPKNMIKTINLEDQTQKQIKREQVKAVAPVNSANLEDQTQKQTKNELIKAVAPVNSAKRFGY